MKYFVLLICLGAINNVVSDKQEKNEEINNEKFQTQPERQLFGWYGAYHPFFNPTLSQYAVNHQIHPTHTESTHVQQHITPHHPMAGPYGMDPYLMGGMMNPYMMGMMNPMMMGMMNPYMMGMMNPMMMGMMNPMMMAGMYNMMGQGMTRTTTEEGAVNNPKNDGSE